MILRKEQLVIPKEKIIEYLLIPKDKNDKSAFLRATGYSLDSWQQLTDDIMKLATSNELKEERNSEFGNLYSVTGLLNTNLVITIWFQQISSEKFRFITLYPYKNERKI